MEKGWKTNIRMAKAIFDDKKWVKKENTIKSNKRNGKKNEENTAKDENDL